MCFDCYLLCGTHPSVGINVSALQLGFHPLPHTDCVGVPLLDSCNTESSPFREIHTLKYFLYERYVMYVCYHES